MTNWESVENGDTSFEHCGRPAYWEGEEVYCSKCQEKLPDYLSCVVPNCNELIEKDIWKEELGFCVEHSNAYFNQELDPFTFERI